VNVAFSPSQNILAEGKKTFLGAALWTMIYRGTLRVFDGDLAVRMAPPIVNFTGKFNVYAGGDRGQAAVTVQFGTLDALIAAQGSVADRAAGGAFNRHFGAAKHF